MRLDVVHANSNVGCQCDKSNCEAEFKENFCEDRISKAPSFVDLPQVWLASPGDNGKRLGLLVVPSDFSARDVA
jgi:hypothetical protein